MLTIKVTCMAQMQVYLTRGTFQLVKAHVCLILSFSIARRMSGMFLWHLHAAFS